MTELLRPDQWLASAQADLQVARYLDTREFAAAIGFHAQQSAEKALKAVLVHRDAPHS